MGAAPSRPDEIRTVANAERPIVGRRHRPGRARFRAQLADDAAAVVDRKLVVVGFDRMRRANLGAFATSFIARLRIVSRHAQNAVLPIGVVAGRPGRRRLAARSQKVQSAMDASYRSQPAMVRPKLASLIA